MARHVMKNMTKQRRDNATGEAVSNIQKQRQVYQQPILCVHAALGKMKRLYTSTETLRAWYIKNECHRSITKVLL